MSYFTSISYSDGPGLDAFGRLRTSDPATLFEVSTQYDLDPIQMQAGASGSAGITPSYITNQRLVQLQTTAGTGSSFYQSYQYLPYYSGKSQLIYFTGSFNDTGVTGSVVDIGYQDLYNGIIYRQNGTGGVQWVKRSSTSGSVVETVASQSNWNIDNLSGAGGTLNPSGLTLNANQSFIGFIDLQFLGMGRVRVGFDINGLVVPVHQFTWANQSGPYPYMQSGTLPISMVINSNASTNTKTAYFKCATVLSECGADDTLSYSFQTPNISVIAASGSRTQLVSIQPQSTFNGSLNRSLFELQGISLVNVGSNPVYWELAIGASFSGGTTYTPISGSYSAFQYASGLTYSNLTNGCVIESGYVSGSGQASTSVLLSDRIPISLDRYGNQQPFGTLTLLLTGLGGSSTVYGTISYNEIR